MFSCCVLLLFIFCMFESYPENKKRDKHKSAQSSKPPEANKNRSQQIAVYFYLCLPFWVWCLWLIVTFAFSANARTIAFVCVFSVYVYLFVIFLLRFFFLLLSRFNASLLFSDIFRFIPHAFFSLFSSLGALICAHTLRQTLALGEQDSTQLWLCTVHTKHRGKEQRKNSSRTNEWANAIRICDYDCNCNFVCDTYFVFEAIAFFDANNCTFSGPTAAAFTTCTPFVCYPPINFRLEFFFC